MKKILAIFICTVILFSLSACKKNITNYESTNSSDIYQSESIVETVTDENKYSTDSNSSAISSITDTSSEPTKLPSTDSNIIDSSTTTNTQSDKNNSYNDIICTTITDFQQVAFSIKDSSTSILLSLPRDWKFEKNNVGYNILKNSVSIGHVTTSIQDSSNEKVNVFTSQLNTNNINVTHNIDQIVSEQLPSYTRTFCYNYKDENGKNQSIVITIPYQESDSSATYKMITEAKLVKTATSTNLGILKINDNRKRILILGNSFIGSSRIGTILQAMCGNELYVEAIATGYAHVGTYTKNPTVMQKIRDGNYSVVFMCGLYDQEAVNDLADMIKVCEDSNTKLAVFPAHNESQPKIEHAISLYPDTIFLNWKAEIDNLINKGIDVSNFCIPDAHNHSTPLAGYVGAHMIYRAVFNKIPQTTQFAEVSESQIKLLVEYITTGSITLIDNNNAYVID